MLLNKAGKNVDEKNITAVLKAAGIDADAAKVKSLIAALDGVNIEEVIAQSSVAVAVAPVSTSATPVEEKKEEKKKEAAPVIDAAAGLGSLF